MTATANEHYSAASRSTAFDIIGDLDATGGKRVRNSIAAAIQAGRVDVTVNLDRVGFLDSSGLASLISSLRLARDKGGDVRVETSNARIRRVLEVTSLARVFKLQPAGDVAA
jgi:anti-sigma B factor antagonist